MMTNDSEDKSFVEFIITETDLAEYKRLDAYFSSKLSEISRSLIKKLFKEGAFTSESKIEFKRMPKLGTKIKFIMPELEETNILPEDLPLDIVYEDEFFIIINKAAGMVVHPAPGNYTGTLVNAILHHCPDLKGIGNERRPGIVHRLDKGTSGIMVVAKEQRTHNRLVELFSTHDIDRKYQAICVGDKIPNKTKMDAPIGRSPKNRLKMATNVSNSKHAITYLAATQFFKKLTHVELTLETGRTHQIRVHLSELLNSPILNDKTYGRIKEEKQKITTAVKKMIGEYEHPFLHAKMLGFIHPITNEKMLFEKEPPELFQAVLAQLSNESDK